MRPDREHAKRTRGIDRPQIVCGLSAHPAIAKACYYFGIELIKAPLDPATHKLTAANVKPLLTRRTVAIYASAPCFSFGLVDEIEELGALAQSRGIGLHVDNCLGGFLLSHMQVRNLPQSPPRSPSISLLSSALVASSLPPSPSLTFRGFVRTPRYATCRSLASSIARGTLL